VQQLRRLGWIEGGNLHIEYRWNDGQAALAQRYAAELVAMAPDVILSASTNNLTALQRLSPTTPIVFVQVSDPVAQGFVLSMARPGGNITGFTPFEFTMGGKWIELLKQLVPALTRVGVMFNPQTSPQSTYYMTAIESAAPKFGVSVAAAHVRNVADIEPTIENFARQSNGGLLFPTDAFTIVHRKLVVEAVARHRVPAIYFSERFVRDSGLISYNPNVEDEFRQAAVYVDRVLKGAKAGDLPVQTPTKFSLVVNLKTARSLNLDLPMSILLAADEQIE
jgi:putative ABC transport system substrate-binding protein